MNSETIETVAQKTNELIELLTTLKEQNPGKIDNIIEDLEDAKKGIDELKNFDDDVIDPYKVSAKGAIQYDVFRERWGLKTIDLKLIERIEKITGTKVHHWIARQIFYCHTDFDKFLDEYEKGTICYIYTGRGPSSESMHLGHLLPFQMTQWLQKVFKIPVIIQMSDDEKVYAKDINHETAYRLTMENAKDIIALGFDPEKTWIFSNMWTVGKEFYINVGKIMKMTTLSTVRNIFGFNKSVNMGMYSWFAFQEAPCFGDSFPDVFGNGKTYCLVPLAIDQYPYFRHVRDIATHQSLKGFKPAVIASKFFPPLSGIGRKMDSSGTVPAVFLTDTIPRIKKAIGTSFTGGGDTLEEQLKNGSNLEVDVPFQWLRHFLADEVELADIARRYGPPVEGDNVERLTSGQVKARLIEIVTEFVQNHQTIRAAITAEQLASYMRRRPLL